ncbi:MAG: hypothetical protein QOE76_3192, partial [Frankiales bacterium]|nr:hypothetical protein [Frankiales bacterium]
MRPNSRSDGIGDSGHGLAPCRGHSASLCD